MEQEEMRHTNNETLKSEIHYEGLLNSVRDFTRDGEEKRNFYLNLFEGVLKGIPDIIRVFNPDKTILFLNEAGYKFFKTNRDAVCGKSCSGISMRKEICDNCDVEKAIKTKQLIRTEKYFQELNKFIECTCNPVLDDSGEVIVVVEQLRDMTEKKILVNAIKESEERYRKIVNLSPEAIIIIADSKIVLANNQACKLVGTDYSKVIGESIYKYIPDELIELTRKRVENILIDKKTKSTLDNKLLRYDNSLIDVEISSSYLTYKGKPAVQSVIRNITEMKKGLNQAAKFQRKYLKVRCPFSNKIKMESVYMPAKTVSGDFFNIYKVNEDLLVGVLWDVSGKGITAALSLSAFSVLFREAVLISYDPHEIVNNLNKKIIDYLDDRYIAACCFSLDFKKNEAKIVGAGINQYMFQKSNCKPEEMVIKGPFLGMFEDSVFDEQIISFEAGDRFYFFTDGLDFILHDEIKEKYIKSHTITEFKNYLNDLLDKMVNEIVDDSEGLKDDSTLIALEIK